MLVSCYTKIN